MTQELAQTQELTTLISGEVETKPLWDGTQHLFKFSNGYGASVVSHQFSYGGPQGQWEIALLDSTGEMIYNDPRFNECDAVVGWLDNDEVQAQLLAIAQFK